MCVLPAQPQSLLNLAADAGARLPAAAGSHLSPQLRPLSLLCVSSTLANFSIEETPQAGPDAGAPLTAPSRRASAPPSRRGAAVPAAGQPRGRGAGRKSRLGWGGSPGPGARSRGLPRSGPEASSCGGTQEVAGQRGPGSYRGPSASSGVSGLGAFGMHFALGHPRPLPPALWGHWDGTKPSATNQRPPWSLSPEP